MTFKISHIICTRNRAAQLKIALSKFNLQELRDCGVELILVDSASTDNTLEVIKKFRKAAPDVVRFVRARRPGAGLARNVGVKAATGDLLAFTDDDCYIEANYHRILLKEFDSSRHHYGMGEVLKWDPDDDSRFANKSINQKSEIPPKTLLRAGVIQSANMFMLRKVFEKVGGFRGDIGAGTPFPCEDIELASRCSLAGYVGVLLPGVRVYHHHGRKTGSAEAEAAAIGYDIGRGAYYASMIMRGVVETWHLWSQTPTGKGKSKKAIVKLEREFRGAADFLKHILESPGNSKR